MRELKPQPTRLSIYSEARTPGMFRTWNEAAWFALRMVGYVGLVWLFLVVVFGLGGE